MVFLVDVGGFWWFLVSGFFCGGFWWFLADFDGCWGLLVVFWCFLMYLKGLPTSSGWFKGL